jgi:hypothetical protein
VFLLRFVQPVQLQRFLANVPGITVLGQPLRARIFYADANTSDDRNRSPGAIYSPQMTAKKLLAPRNWYFRDLTGETTLVEIQGVPVQFSLAGITYTMRRMLRDHHFEWAFPWRNTAGFAQHPELNATPIAVHKYSYKMEIGD